MATVVKNHIDVFTVLCKALYVYGIWLQGIVRVRMYDFRDFYYLCRLALDRLKLYALEIASILFVLQ